MGYSKIEVSEFMIDTFVQSIIDRPLVAGEIRRIDDAGDTYLALGATSVENDDIEYTEQYKFTIEDTEYKIYARL